MAKGETKSTRQMQDLHRERIKTAMLLNRLQDNSLAEVEFMTPSQIQSAKILLAKTLPDLKQVEHSGSVDGTINVYLNKPNG